MRTVRPILSIVLMSVVDIVAASTCTVRSPIHRVALVELYTSQGCSSCPPADRWLSALPQRFRSTEAIALSLHVGYWDYIGWKDPYARREFNERQREWASANQSATVYTPGVFVQGKEVRDWYARQGIARQVAATNAMPAGATIEVSGQIEGQEMHVEVVGQTAAPAPGAGLRVALVQSGLRTAVKAGENRGEQLANDHVAREWSGPLPLGRHRLRFSLPAGVSPDDWAVVAFVQAGGGKEVLQAVRWTPRDCRS
jgi:hypothetical protein